MTKEEIKNEMRKLPSEIVEKFKTDPNFTIIQSNGTNYDAGLVKISLHGNEAHYMDGSLITLLYS